MMPTPTIDPAAYEAAYQAVRQYTIDNSVLEILCLLGIIFVLWLFGGDK